MTETESMSSIGGLRSVLCKAWTSKWVFESSTSPARSLEIPMQSDLVMNQLDAILCPW